jgi:predicted branched-subunit amino acid permease
MIIDSHVHLYGFSSLATLEKKISRMKDAIALRTRYPELYAAALTDDERENIMWRTANRIFGLNIGGN